MKSILVPVEQHDRIEATLDIASQLALKYGSYVEGFWLEPGLDPLMTADALGASIVYDADPLHLEEARRHSRLLFEQTMRQRLTPAATSSSDQPSFAWTEPDQRTNDDFLGRYGRVFDITVVGRPGPERTSPRMSTLEAALFDSGRPILLAPPRAAASFGDNVVISWNASTEIARALTDALPLVASAARVTVLAIPGHGPADPDPALLVRQLGRHGIDADLAVVPSKAGYGETILEQCAELGCDLLIKGAYTQARIRQFIFGGATRHIITEANLPVLMAH